MEKENFLNNLEREFQTTMKVLQAYPADKMDFKPHDISRSARDLIATLGQEESMMVQYAHGSDDWSKSTTPKGQTIEELIGELTQIHEEVMKELKAVTEFGFTDLKVKMGNMELRAIDACWYMLLDQIHHRGQFSVYLRMAGGKVPAIYGPSYDEKM